MHHMCRQGSDTREPCSPSQALRFCRSLAYNNFSGQLPASWLANTSFVALLHLDVSHNRLSGSLPAALLLGQLQVSLVRLCSVHAGSAVGSSCSPARLAERTFGAVPGTRCTCLQPLQGLWQPCEAAGLGVMRTPTAVQVLDVQHNLLSGPLPSSWSQVAVLARALELRLSSNCLTGTLPDAWAGASAFPLLQVPPPNMLRSHPLPSIPCGGRGG